jgi:putative SbcD/Mre11-related phosphoesterase
MVQPVPGEPAAIADCGDERAVVVADYHAGLEVALRRDGVELRSAAGERRDALVTLVDRERPDRVVILGDLANAIGRPGDEERGELDDLFAALTERAPVTVAKGNHDGDLEDVVAELGYHDVTVTEGSGVRIGDVGFAHGHTWPARACVEAETLCVAHEHPQVRLQDEVGGGRTERVWLRGRLNPEPFEAHYEAPVDVAGDVVVFPAFNDRVGGTWVNQQDSFLSPFLPEALADAEAYLLDGTRLGDYRRV